MMKDRYQKQKLLQYFLDKGWYPQLEVDIYYQKSSYDKPKMITDIDVLALVPSPSGILSPIIGDCKTLKNQSPINRVFWIKGLMSYLDSDFGIILLSKAIEGEHKLLANDLNVTLLSDEDFAVYSKAMSPHNSISAALTNFETWDKYFDIPNKFPTLIPLFVFCKSGYWNERNSSVSIRHCISKLQQIKFELNPSNNINIFLFLELCSLFSIAINEMTIRIFNKFHFPKEREPFENELKIILWGGQENYQFFNNLRNRLVPKQSEEQTELTLPEWGKFVQLIRSCLDAPLSTSVTPLILKELAFQFLAEQQSLNNIQQEFLIRLTKTNPQATKYAIFIIEYLARAAKIPPEFIDIPISVLMKIQRPE